jgi:hypothetical protein
VWYIPKAVAEAGTLPRLRAERRYLRTPLPLHFPVEQRVPEGDAHFRRRILLYLSLRRELYGRGLVSSDQFVYWDATDPTKCLAPDVAVRLGSWSDEIKSWKTWEWGAPHVGVEIVSDSDEAEHDFSEKLERYSRAGIGEVVRFDPSRAARPLRLWDLLSGDLVERDLADPKALHCDALGLYWCAREDPTLGLTVRLCRDPEGNELVPTPEEAERWAKEAERSAKEAERSAKETALLRIAELEAELSRRG